MSVTPPRPGATPEIKEAAAREIVADLVSNGYIEGPDADDAARDIALVAWRHMDGYELARSLEDDHHWSCSFAMAEILDGFASTLCAKVTEAQHAWAAEHGIAPSIEPGTLVKFGRRGETGVVSGIDPHGPARYRVRVESDPPNCWRLIDFEDALPVESAGATP